MHTDHYSGVITQKDSDAIQYCQYKRVYIYQLHVKVSFTNLEGRHKHEETWILRIYFVFNSSAFANSVSHEFRETLDLQPLIQQLGKALVG